MDITLVVLAAGIGARYGGVKQLESVGPNGELIIDYSIHDAIQAGFDRVVFILREDIFQDFKEVIGNRMEARFRALGVKWDYAFQKLSDPPEGRVKPWGTGQAILSCKGLLNGPFAVINADDYYGKQAYVRASQFLSACRPDAPGQYGMVGFVLKNTLSDAGGVTRGVCGVDAMGYLTAIRETRNIVKTANGAAVMTEDGPRPLDENCLVSMNMWMLTPDFLDGLEAGFAAFRAGMKDPMKDEYLLPDIIDGLLREKRAVVKVLSTTDPWFGVTYQEDKPLVVRSFRELIARGVYNEDLFSDL